MLPEDAARIPNEVTKKTNKQTRRLLFLNILLSKAGGGVVCGFIKIRWSGNIQTQRRRFSNSKDYGNTEMTQRQGFND